MCYRNVTPSPAEKWGRRGTEFFPPQFWGWGWGRGHFLASLTWGKWDLFPPTFLCCCCRAVAREQQESLAVAALHRAGSTAQCVLAPGMAQPSIFISSHHLQHGRSSLGELEQASPLHTFKPGPHYPVHFATRIWQQTDIKSPPGGLRWLLHCLTKKLILILNPTVQFLWRHRYCIPEIKWVFLSQTRCWPPQPSPPGRNRRSPELQAEPRANVSQAGLVSFQHQ